ncbi:hypothetical protein HLB23_29020 [Nocardia uniformis]|uniref:Uncharacterized protein n=1 Tax=Nocardia uniformis TaxID=53432 RepID=A0A849CEN3_9NOCA|nr:hypothetical protein [Nocardia uniformis]NNH73849.1 hypothetical protein [Nocardia uniformis]
MRHLRRFGGCSAPLVASLTMAATIAAVFASAMGTAVGAVIMTSNLHPSVAMAPMAISPLTMRPAQPGSEIRRYPAWTAAREFLMSV